MPKPESTTRRPRKQSSRLATKVPRDRNDMAAERRVGVAAPVVKMTLWLNDGEARALRLRALHDNRSESSLAREAVKRFLGID